MKLMLNVSKITNQHKKKIKSSRKINLLTTSLLIYLVENNNFLPTKSTKKIKTTKEVLVAILDKDKVKTKIFLDKVLMLLSKKKKPREIYPISYITIAMRRIIKQQNFFSQGKTEISQKISNYLSKFCINKTNIDHALKAILEQVLCIWYSITF